MGHFSHGLTLQIVMMVIYMLFLDAGVLSGAGAVCRAGGRPLSPARAAGPAARDVARDWDELGGPFSCELHGF